MRRFLIDSFNAAYGLYQDIKTGNYREDREADELALKRNVARYSNFAAQYGLPQLNVEKASSVQISQYLEKSAKLLLFRSSSQTDTIIVPVFFVLKYPASSV